MCKLLIGTIAERMMDNATSFCTKVGNFSGVAKNVLQNKLLFSSKWTLDVDKIKHTAFQLPHIMLPVGSSILRLHYL